MTELVDHDDVALGSGCEELGDAGVLENAPHGVEAHQVDTRAARSEAVDDEAIVHVPAGGLVERTVDDEGDAIPKNLLTHARWHSETAASIRFAPGRGSGPTRPGIRRASP